MSRSFALICHRVLFISIFFSLYRSLALLYSCPVAPLFFFLLLLLSRISSFSVLFHLSLLSLALALSLSHSLSLLLARYLYLFLFRLCLFLYYWPFFYSPLSYSFAIPLSRSCSRFSCAKLLICDRANEYNCNQSHVGLFCSYSFVNGLTVSHAIDRILN